MSKIWDSEAGRPPVTGGITPVRGKGGSPWNWCFVRFRRSGYTGNGFFRWSGGRIPPDSFRQRLLVGARKGSAGYYWLSFYCFDKFACQYWAAWTIKTPPKCPFIIGFGVVAPPAWLFFLRSGVVGYPAPWQAIHFLSFYDHCRVRPCKGDEYRWECRVWEGRIYIYC